MLSRRTSLFGALAASTIFDYRAFGQNRPKPDFADLAAGFYDGDVISDARGSSMSNVRVAVYKTGPNTIYIAFSYQRMPPFYTKLNRYMSTIQNVGGHEVFLLDLAKQPNSLNVTVDNASWAGTKNG